EQPAPTDIDIREWRVSQPLNDLHRFKVKLRTGTVWGLLRESHLMSKTDTPLALLTHGAEAEGSRGKSPKSAAMTLHTEAALVRTVRRFTDDLLRLWQIGREDRDAAVLIVDELASNAVQHGRTDMTLLLTLNGGILRVAVADTGARALHPGTSRDPDECGRGMGIIEHLADRVEFHKGDRRWVAYTWLRVRPLPGQRQGRTNRVEPPLATAEAGHQPATDSP
ncbi:ATP-binding protein, partial [Streptomyces sp. NPDC002547]